MTNLTSWSEMNRKEKLGAKLKNYCIIEKERNSRNLNDHIELNDCFVYLKLQYNNPSKYFHTKWSYNLSSRRLTFVSPYLCTKYFLALHFYSKTLKTQWNTIVQVQLQFQFILRFGLLVKDQFPISIVQIMLEFHSLALYYALYISLIVQ